MGGEGLWVCRGGGLGRGGEGEGKKGGTVAPAWVAV